MKISIIIPTLNNPTLPKTLASVFQQTCSSDEVLVVGLFEENLCQLFPKARFISTGRPVNAATARNIGMRESKGDVFLFIDSDCIALSNWLETHRKYHQRGIEVLGGGVEITSKNYWTLSDNLSMFHDFMTDCPAGEKFLLPTLNLSLNRSIFERFGGMDESFPGAGGEDSDWTIKLRLAGVPLLFIPTAVVLHSPSRTQFKDLFYHWYHSGQNNIRVRMRYRKEFKTPWWASSPFCLYIFSPFIAAWTTFKMYGSSQFWTYWPNIPAVYITKIIYCWGAANRIKTYGLQ